MRQRKVIARPFVLFWCLSYSVWSSVWAWPLGPWGKPSWPSCLYEQTPLSSDWWVGSWSTHTSPAPLPQCTFYGNPDSQGVLPQRYSSWVLMGKCIGLAEPDRVTHSHFLTWTPSLPHPTVPSTSKVPSYPSNPTFSISFIPSTAQCLTPWAHRVLPKARDCPIHSCSEGFSKAMCDLVN